MRRAAGPGAGTQAAFAWLVFVPCTCVRAAAQAHGRARHDGLAGLIRDKFDVPAGCKDLSCANKCTPPPESRSNPITAPAEITLKYMHGSAKLLSRPLT